MHSRIFCFCPPLLNRKGWGEAMNLCMDIQKWAGYVVHNRIIIGNRMLSYDSLMKSTAIRLDARGHICAGWRRRREAPWAAAVTAGLTQQMIGQWSGSNGNRCLKLPPFSSFLFFASSQLKVEGVIGRKWRRIRRRAKMKQRASLLSLSLFFSAPCRCNQTTCATSTRSAAHIGARKTVGACKQLLIFQTLSSSIRRGIAT